MTIRDIQTLQKMREKYHNAPESDAALLLAILNSMLYTREYLPQDITPQLTPAEQETHLANIYDALEIHPAYCDAVKHIHALRMSSDAIRTRNHEMYQALKRAAGFEANARITFDELISHVAQLREPQLKLF